MVVILSYCPIVFTFSQFISLFPVNVHCTFGFHFVFQHPPNADLRHTHCPCHPSSIKRASFHSFDHFWRVFGRVLYLDAYAKHLETPKIPWFLCLNCFYYFLRSLTTQCVCDNEKRVKEEGEMKIVAQCRLKLDVICMLLCLWFYSFGQARMPHGVVELWMSIDETDRSCDHSHNASLSKNVWVGERGGGGGGGGGHRKSDAVDW